MTAINIDAKHPIITPGRSELPEDEIVNAYRAHYTHCIKYFHGFRSMNKKPARDWMESLWDSKSLGALPIMQKHMIYRGIAVRRLLSARQEEHSQISERLPWPTNLSIYIPGVHDPLPAPFDVTEEYLDDKVVKLTPMTNTVLWARCRGEWKGEGKDTLAGTVCGSGDGLLDITPGFLIDDRISFNLPEVQDVADFEIPDDSDDLIDAISFLDVVCCQYTLIDHYEIAKYSSWRERRYYHTHVQTLMEYFRLDDSPTVEEME
jgi:hypothetical protein